MGERLLNPKKSDSVQASLTIEECDTAIEVITKRMKSNPSESERLYLLRDSYLDQRILLMER